MRAEPIDEPAGYILYIDGQQLTRDCISSELARHLTEFNIVDHSTAKDLASGDPDIDKFAVVIVHVHAGRMDLGAHHESLDRGGIANELSILERIAPETPRVLLSDTEVPEDIVEAFRSRIRGFAPTTLPIGQVVGAIRIVAAGGTFVPLSVLALLARPILAPENPSSHKPSDGGTFDRLPGFSPRQNEVLRMLWNGSANKLIAYELRMSESTVKVHIRHIMKKLNVTNRTQVVVRTRQLSLGDDSRIAVERVPRTLPAPVSIGSFPIDRQIHSHASAGLVDRMKDAARQNGSRQA
jgi:DNA-binding NarL/FixJ family response regulator